MSRFLNARYAALEEYVPGEQPKDGVSVKLNTNENPYPPSPKVKEALSAAEIDRLNLYPSVTGGDLIGRLAKRCRVREENLFLVNGSDDALNFAFMAYGSDGVAYPDISYGFYKVFADLYGWEQQIIPLREDFSIDPGDYCGLGKMVVIANPNAPTGLALRRAEIERILAANQDHVVLIDEAYTDFGGESCIPLIWSYPNLLVVQTFSKYRSLAGMRLGFAVGSPALIADLNKLRFSTNPYNLDRLALLAGAAALDDEDYYLEKKEEIVYTREKTVLRLQEMGFRCIPSSTNFIFCETDRMGGGELYRRLKENGVLVRHFDAPRISNFLRITVGTPAQMETLLANLNTILG